MNAEPTAGASSVETLLEALPRLREVYMGSSAYEI